MKTVFPIALLALTFLLFGAPSASSQTGWVLHHYNCIGTTTVNGVSAPWPSPTNSVSFNINNANSISCVGTVSAVFVWNGTGPAPSTLNVLITSSSAEYGTGNPPDDGFQDPVVTGYSRVSSGSHLVQIPNPGHSSTVTVSPVGQTGYSLSATTNGGISVLFQASVRNAVLQGYSTHVSPALTGSEPNISVWDPAHAKYFSGTGCEAKATAVPLTGYLSHVQLCIVDSGTDVVVKEYYDKSTPGAPSISTAVVLSGSNQTNATLSALFDSTHFADASPITIKMKVWDTNSGYNESKLVVPAYNKAYSIVNPTVLTSTPITAPTLLKNINYTSPPASVTDDGAAIEQNLGTSTVFYASTHGNSGLIEDCLYNPKKDIKTSSPVFATYAIGTAEAPGQVINTVEGTIIYKSVNVLPPANFAYLSACETLNNDQGFGRAFAAGFQMPADGRANDRALVGFTDNFLTDNHNQEWENCFWTNLSRGFTVLESVCFADSIIGQVDTTGVIIGSKSYGWRNTEPVIQGDKAATIHGVYGNNNHATNLDNIGTYPTTADAWEKPLP